MIVSSRAIGTIGNISSSAILVQFRSFAGTKPELGYCIFAQAKVCNKLLLANMAAWSNVQHSLNIGTHGRHVLYVVC